MDDFTTAEIQAVGKLDQLLAISAAMQRYFR
jgi:hypothetical protein